MSSSIGEIIRDRRKQFGYTQAEFSAMSGIRQEVISRIENGKYNVGDKTLSRLAGLLKLDSEMLEQGKSAESDTSIFSSDELMLISQFRMKDLQGMLEIIMKRMHQRR